MVLVRVSSHKAGLNQLSFWPGLLLICLKGSLSPVLTVYSGWHVTSCPPWHLPRNLGLGREAGASAGLCQSCVQAEVVLDSGMTEYVSKENQYRQLGCLEGWKQSLHF